MNFAPSTLCAVFAVSLLLHVPAWAQDVSPRTKTYNVNGGALRVTVRYQTDRGQWHLADRVAITASNANPLVLQSHWNDEGGVDGDLVPLIEQIREVDDSHWLLLGWSSWGEGLQRDCAWLVGLHEGRVKLIDRLEFEAERGFLAFAFDPAPRRYRIGVPHPPKREQAHLPGHWSLLIAGKRLVFDEIRALDYGRYSLSDLKDGYAPPSRAPPSQRGWDGMVAWYDVTSAGFHASARKREP